MGKIIMASPKVIAVTFDQANSMKSKYNDFVKNNSEVKSTEILQDTPSVSDSLNVLESDPVVDNFTQQETTPVVDSVAENENIFSTPLVTENVEPQKSELGSALETKIEQKLDGVTLTDSELSELEAGLIEVIDIAKASITSVIEKYRQKGKTVANQEVVSVTTEQQPNTFAAGSDSFTSGGNIFDSPSEGKKIA